MLCPRRVEDGCTKDSPFVYGQVEDDTRKDGTCGYCGSMSPAQFFEAIEAGEELIPTDKNYKVYVGSSHKKFYFYHLSTQEKINFVSMYNAKAVKMGYPGYFYVDPFFMVIVDNKKERSNG